MPKFDLRLRVEVRGCRLLVQSCGWRARGTSVKGAFASLGMSCEYCAGDCDLRSKIGSSTDKDAKKAKKAKYESAE
eukprot:15441010-Alexandrium_andersonii.AAC.1